MNLSFTQQIKKVDNFFLEKIWNGLIHNKIASFTALDQFRLEAYHKGLLWATNANLSKPSRPKIHTIRNGTRWKTGMLIHFCIGLRTKNYFRFAPVLPVKSVQHIKILAWNEAPVIETAGSFVYHDFDGKGSIKHFNVMVIESPLKYRILKKDQVIELAINDGFENEFDFFQYFKEGTKVASLIHWTDKTY